ncbi:MAG TPA: hypothetical protein VFQ80_14250, partial [Thermomicrobiales bacterium]|nr:hypothetical protein [Thermomicrobiales bacterium]
RQFVGQGLKALVPNVVGQTAAAQQAKAASRAASTRQWDEASFFEEIEERRGPTETAVARDILDWAARQELRVWWGRGGKDGSFYPMIDRPDGAEWTVGVFTYGRVEIEFEHLAREHQRARWHPFVPDAKRRQLLDRLNAIPGVHLPENALARRPSISLEVFAAPAIRSQFFAVLDWLVAELTVVPGETERSPE